MWDPKDVASQLDAFLDEEWKSNRLRVSDMYVTKTMQQCVRLSRRRTWRSVGEPVSFALDGSRWVTTTRNKDWHRGIGDDRVLMMGTRAGRPARALRFLTPVGVTDRAEYERLRGSGMSVEDAFQALTATSKASASLAAFFDGD
jgi:hypothetical protein